MILEITIKLAKIAYEVTGRSQQIKDTIDSLSLIGIGRIRPLHVSPSDKVTLKLDGLHFATFKDTA